jgi:hypothetical protein
MNPAAEMESVARAYLDGGWNLSDLEEWLVPNLSILFALPESAFVSQLAASIMLAIAEIDAEGLSENHLRGSIRDLLPDKPVTVVVFPSSPDPLPDTVFTSNTVEVAEVA